MNARELALHVVRDVFPVEAGNAERGAQEALDYRLRRADLDPRDRSFATELAYGSIKMRRTLDWYAAAFVGQRSKPLPPAIAEIVRLGLYEIVFTQADDHATVFEYVNLAKKYGHKGVAGLVNAVLRSFLRDRPAPPAPQDFEDPDEYLGVACSLPNWLVRQWRAAFPDAIEAICAAVNLPAQSAITVNRLRASVEDIENELRAAGATPQRSIYVEETLVVGGGSPAARERASQGAWFVQGESPAMPVAVLNPQPGDSVLDVASGRGNKALQIAARMQGEGSLTCVERDERRSAMLAERLTAGGAAAAIVVGDATTEVLPPASRFDRVLIDAPCSGVGVVGRHPEARWRKRADDGARLAPVQAAMLETMAAHVAPGGVVVYAVCSTDPRETTEVVDGFLRRREFTRGLIPEALAPFQTAQGDVLVPPGLQGRDGFYIARLERQL
ncbi:MAG TPA: transcription antitermination factor NusB [Candidatus Baltobacteraceae bacterium]